MRSVVSIIAVLITAQRADAESLAADTVPSVDVGLAAEPAGDLPKAKPSKRRGKKKGGTLPRLDPQREEKEFARKLALAQSLQTPERCGAAYAMLLDLQKQQPENPDVLWGIGECAVLISAFPERAEQKVQLLGDARAAYEAYAKRSGGSPVEHIRIALAARRAGELGRQIAALTPAPETPATPSPAPPAKAPVVAEPPRDLSLGHAQQLAQARNLTGALAELEALMHRHAGQLDLEEYWVLWRAATEQCDGVMPVYERIAERSWRPEVHMAGSECADRAKDVRAHLSAVERYVRTVQFVGDPEVFYGLAEGFAALGDRQHAGNHFQRFLQVAPSAHPKRYIAEMYLTDSEHLHVDCLTRTGIVRPRAVQVGGQWVSELRLPPNYRTIACGD